MTDLETRLHRLGGQLPTADPASDDTVVADLRRAHGARRSRRVRRGAIAAGTCAVAAAATATAVIAGHSAPRTVPQARAAAPATHVAPTASGATAPSRSAVRLVSYDGRQLPGFTVRQIPDGYVLQGVSGSTLDIATADDHTSLDVFSGKLTVGIEQDSGDFNGYRGRPVDVDGHPGVIADQDGTVTVVYEQGGGSDNIVIVQKWSTISLTDDQLVDFAKGITVTGQAQRQHG